MVYVLNVFGQPLMPTEDHRKVRLLLKEGKAVVVKNSPFTIRLKVRMKLQKQKGGRTREQGAHYPPRIEIRGFLVHV